MDQFSLPFIFVVAFLAVVLGVQVLVGGVLSARDRTQRMNRRLTMLEQGMRPEDVYAALVRKGVGARRSDMPGREFLERLDRICHQASVPRPEQLLLYTATAAAALWLVGMIFLSRNWAGGPLSNSTLALFGAVGISLASVWLWVTGRRAKRVKMLEEQLPLALDIIVRSIRAGHPVISAVQLASREMGDPIGSEFGLVVDETTYGYEFREALLNFARRTGSGDARFFAVSVSIQAETGGNLAEILENLNSVIRGRTTLGKKVKALASEGRISAVLLSVLPIFLVSFISLTQPEFYTSKFSHPIFWPVIGVVGIVYLVGWMMIHRIINFRY